MDDVKFFSFRVEYFWDHKVTSSRGFVAAENYADAAAKVIEAFEEDDNIITLSLADSDCDNVMMLDDADQKHFVWDKTSECIGEEEIADE